MSDFIVHCAKCGYERSLGTLPMPLDVMGALGKLPCGSCKASARHIRMGQKPKPTEPGDYMGWLINGDTGISSKTIWSVMAGRHPGG